MKELKNLKNKTNLDEEAKTSIVLAGIIVGLILIGYIVVQMMNVPYS